MRIGRGVSAGIEVAQQDLGRTIPLRVHDLSQYLRRTDRRPGHKVEVSIVDGDLLCRILFPQTYPVDYPGKPGSPQYAAGMMRPMRQPESAPVHRLKSCRMIENGAMFSAIGKTALWPRKREGKRVRPVRPRFASIRSRRHPCPYTP